jgi:hypothetical protein
VTRSGMKLPVQPLLRSVKDLLVTEALAAAAAGAPVASAPSTGSMPGANAADKGGAMQREEETEITGAAAELLCHNPLFTLRARNDAPGELFHFPPEDFLP